MSKSMSTVYNYFCDLYPKKNMSVKNYDIDSFTLISKLPSFSYYNEITFIRY
jgi:hypothetical protein